MFNVCLVVVNIDAVIQEQFHTCLSIKYKSKVYSIYFTAKISCGVLVKVLGWLL